MFPANADPVLVERVVADMSAAPPHVALAALESVRTFGCRVPDLLRDVDVPVAAINPEYPPTDVTSMREHGVAVTCLPDVGHFLMMERPERFNACLAKVLASFEPDHGFRQLEA
jgi:pimeloyl-ACP methyl ester carboxylesterase